MDEVNRTHRDWWQAWRRLIRYSEYLNPDATAGRRDQFGPALAEVDEFRRLDDSQRAAIDRWVQSWIAAARSAGSAPQVEAGERRGWEIAYAGVRWSRSLPPAVPDVDASKQNPEEQQIS